MTGAVRMVPSRRRDQPDRYTHVNVPKKVQAVSRAAQRRCSAQPRPPPELWVWSEPPDASMYEHGGVAIVRTNPPRVRGIPLGPISQCIDTKWGNGFGTSLRKYRIRPSAGRPIRGIRKIKYVKYARLSKRTARCGTDLNERYHQDMKQLFKDMANACVPQLVHSAGPLEHSPAPARKGAIFTTPCLLCPGSLSPKDLNKVD